MSIKHKLKGRRWLGLLLIFAVLLLLPLMVYGPTWLEACCGSDFASQVSGLKPPATALNDINFGIRDDNGKLTLTGEVPSEEDKQNVLTLANGVYGSSNFIDQVTVSTHASLPRWWLNVNGALIWLKSNTGFSLSQRGEVITLAGRVPKEAAKIVKEGEVRAFFAGTTTINNLLTSDTLEPKSAVNVTP